MDRRMQICLLPSAAIYVPFYGVECKFRLMELTFRWAELTFQRKEKKTYRDEKAVCSRGIRITYRHGFIM